MVCDVIIWHRKSRVWLDGLKPSLPIICCIKLLCDLLTSHFSLLRLKKIRLGREGGICIAWCFCAAKSGSIRKPLMRILTVADPAPATVLTVHSIHYKLWQDRWSDQKYYHINTTVLLARSRQRGLQHRNIFLSSISHIFSFDSQIASRF